MTRRRMLPLVASPVLAAQRPRIEPAGVAAILNRILKTPPAAFNTDWFGTMPLHGALMWSRRGVNEAGTLAKAWFEHHLKTKDAAKYSGPRSRVVWAGGIPITTYAGHFGMSIVCEDLVDQFGEARAREVACGIAEIILHRTARNHLGLVGHDDMADFAIPDVTFFTVSSLMIAARFDPKGSAAYRESALYQLRTAIDTFLVAETGLAKTLVRAGGLGNTYWTRASGWLLWAMTAMLRRIDPNHATVPAFKADLARLVDGMTRVQTAEGGFHVLLDDCTTPLDATGPAMFALAVRESVRRGWLSADYLPAVARAWEFVKANLTDSGVLRNTYDLWALPAENRDMKVRDENSGWAMGFVLALADEMTR